MRYDSLFTQHEFNSQADSKQIHPGAFLIGGLIGIILTSCLLAPWVKRFLMFLGEHSSFFAHLGEYDLHRIMSRIIMIFVILFVLSFRHIIFGSGKVFSVLESTGSDGYLLMAGLMLGIMMLVVQIGFAVFFDARHFYTASFTVSKFLYKLFSAVISASIIGFLEEFIFRGVIFRQLRRKQPLIIAFILSSALYAALHFFKPQDIAGIDQTAPLSGFVVLIEMFKPFASMEFVMEFTGLFLAGLCLAAGYHFSKSLYFSIGMHAGWIIIIKLDGLFVTRTIPEAVTLWGSSNMVGGMVTWGLLGITFVLIAKVFSDWI